MDAETAIRQIIGGFAVAPFVFSIAPVGFFVGLVPSSPGHISVIRISEAEYVFLRRLGIPEVIVVM